MLKFKVSGNHKTEEGAFQAHVMEIACGHALVLVSEDMKIGLITSSLTNCVLLCHTRSQNFSLISKMEIGHLPKSPYSTYIS